MQPLEYVQGPPKYSAPIDLYTICRPGSTKWTTSAWAPRPFETELHTEECQIHSGEERDVGARRTFHVSIPLAHCAAGNIS